MHRPTIGIVALFLLTASLVVYLVQPDDDQFAAWMSAFLRVGMVTAAFWLAQPQLVRFPRWILWAVLAVVLGGLVAARNPRILVLGLVVMVVVARLRPRP